MEDDLAFAVEQEGRARLARTEALEGLAGSREALRAAIVAANGVALGEIKHTHPILGELDLYQWLIFLGEHGRGEIGNADADLVVIEMNPDCNAHGRIEAQDPGRAATAVEPGRRAPGRVLDNEP